MGFLRRLILGPNEQEDKEMGDRAITGLCTMFDIIPPAQIQEWESKIKSDASFARMEEKRIERAIPNMQRQINSPNMMLSKLLEELHRQRDFITEYGGKGGSFTPPPPPRRSGETDKALEAIELEFARQVAIATTTARVNELKAWREVQRRKVIGM